ncbi:PAS domain S-box protein [candidate division KSB1 bacterium]|nr:PAS domain S-box protein [candidate division KSB1 bacterium]
MQVEKMTKTQLIDEVQSLRRELRTFKDKTSNIELVKSRNAALNLLEDLQDEINERKRFENKLGESEAKYRLLFQNANDLVLLHQYTDEKMPDTFMDINERAVEVLGYTREELLNCTPMDVISKDHLLDVTKLSRKLMQDKQSLFERTLITKDGNEIPVEIHSRLFHYKNKPTTLSICRDISERKKAENILLESEKRYRELAELLPQTVFEMDTRGNLTYINKHGIKTFGYSQAELKKGLNLSQLLPPEEMKRGRKQMQLMLEDKGQTGNEYQAMKNDGTPINILVYNIPVHSEGKHIGWRGAVIDITERKQVEETLRRSEETVRDILETSRDWIWTIDVNGKHTYSNPAIEKILGYSPQELLAKSSFQFILEDDRALIESKMPKWIANKSGWKNLEMRWRHKDGSIRWLESNAVPIFDDENNLVGFRGVDRDITERKNADEAITQSEKKYRFLTENITDVIWIFDVEAQKFTYVSPSVFKQRGYTAEEIMTQSLEEAVIPSSREKLFKLTSVHFKTFKKTGESVVHIDELELPCKDGSMIWGELLSYYRSNPDTGKVEVIGVTRDITDRKKSEEALWKSEELLNKTGEIARVGGWEINLDTQTVFWTETTKRIHEVPMDYIPTVEEAIKFYPDESQVKIAKVVNHATKEGIPYDVELELVSAKGNRLWVHTTGYPEIHDGKCIRMWGTFQDITDHKQIMVALQESEELYRQLFELESDALFLIENDTGQILEANEAACALYRYTHDEMLAKKNTDLSAEPDITRLVTESTPIIKDNVVTIPLRYHQKKDGSEFIVEITGRFFEWKGKSVHIAAIRDITKRQMDDETLRESESNLQKAFEIAGIGQWKYDIKNDRFDWNQTALDVIGFTEDGIPQNFKAYQAFFHPDDIEMISESVEKSHKSGMTNIEHRLIIDGKIKWIITRSHIEFNKAGKAEVAVGIIQDVTERRMAEKYIAISEERYRELFNHMSSGVAVYQVIDHGKDFIFKDFNMAGERIDGQSRKFLIGKSIFDVRPGVEEFGLIEAFRTVLKTGKPKHHPISMYKDNQLTGWYDNYIYQLPSGELVVVFDDVTEVKLADIALLENEIKFRSLFENTSSMIILHDMEGHFLDVNAKALEDWGYTKDEFLKMQITDMDPDFLKRDDPKIFWKQLDKKANVRFESNILRKDGSFCPVEIMLSKFLLHEQKVIMAVCRDIEERKMAEKALEQHRKELQRLSTQLIRTQEEERKRLSRELHDEMGQSLTSIKLNLTSIKNELKGKLSRPVSVHLQETDQLAEGLLEQMHDISLNLRPNMLDDLGLEPALKWLVNHNRKQWGIKIKLQFKGLQQRLNPDIETAIYRIVQESLNNIVKHARAKEVILHIRMFKSGKLRLTISDDGRGFDMKKVHQRDPSSRGIGILGMQERTSNLGGTITIQSEPKKGTSIQVELPLSKTGLSGR